MNRVARVVGFFSAGGVLVFMATCGCGGATTLKKLEERVYDIAITSLTRGISTASAFTNSLIRVRLEPGDYAVVGQEIHVYGTIPNTPPVVTFRLLPALPPPNPKSRIVVAGRVDAPKRDGVWRSSQGDYCLTVNDCIVTGLTP